MEESGEVLQFGALSSATAGGGVDQSMSPVWYVVLSIFVVVVFTLGMGLLIHLSAHKRKFRLSHIVYLMALLASLPLWLFGFMARTGLLSQAAADPTPRHVQAIKVSETMIALTWRTNTPVSGGYRLTDPGSSAVVDQRLNMTEPKLSHEFELHLDDPSKQYLLEIFSGNHWYSTGGNPIVISSSYP